MSTLPTVPSFTNGDTSILKLQQLAYAVSFLVDCDESLRPTAHIYKNSTLALPATTNTSVPLGDNAWLNDPTYVAPNIVIQTQGYYSLEAHIGTEFTASSRGTYVVFLLTAGVNNPLGNGVTVLFGYRGGQAVSVSAQDTDYCISALAPTCLYVGDAVTVQAYSTQATTINFNANTNYVSGRFVPNMTAIWIREGP
jgi:hypothetical protein